MVLCHPFSKSKPSNNRQHSQQPRVQATKSRRKVWRHREASIQWMKTAKVASGPARKAIYWQMNSTLKVYRLLSFRAQSRKHLLVGQILLSCLSHRGIRQHRWPRNRLKKAWTTSKWCHCHQWRASCLLTRSFRCTYRDRQKAGLRTLIWISSMEKSTRWKAIIRILTQRSSDKTNYSCSHF